MLVQCSHQGLGIGELIERLPVGVADREMVKMRRFFALPDGRRIVLLLFRAQVDDCLHADLFEHVEIPGRQPRQLLGADDLAAAHGALIACRVTADVAGVGRPLEVDDAPGGQLARKSGAGQAQ